MIIYYCTSCGLGEDKCKCERFCILCSSEDDARLCQDGCYYCRECREVCEFTPSDDPSTGIR